MKAISHHLREEIDHLLNIPCSIATQGYAVTTVMPNEQQQASRDCGAIQVMTKASHPRSAKEMFGTEEPMFESVQLYQAFSGLTLDRNTEWRVCKKLLGEIQGLPTSRGQLAITNGILCHIVKEDNTIFIGHIGWFVPDNKEVDMAEIAGKGFQRKMPSAKKQLMQNILDKYGED